MRQDHTFQILWALTTTNCDGLWLRIVSICLLSKYLVSVGYISSHHVTVINPMLAVINPTSDVIIPTSAVINPTSDVINPTSGVINPTSAVINPTSAVIIKKQN